LRIFFVKCYHPHDALTLYLPFLCLLPVEDDADEFVRLFAQMEKRVQVLQRHLHNALTLLLPLLCLLPAEDDTDEFVRLFARMEELQIQVCGA
jgi:hypothetical protein